MGEPSKEELTRFKDPLELWKKVQPEALGVPEDEFFNRSNQEYQRYRDAWAASLFARGFYAHVSQCAVRLVLHPDVADFQIEVSQKFFDFQLVEVLPPDYKRGKEYAQMKAGPESRIPSKLADINEGPKWIAEMLNKKAKKRYQPTPHVLLYADFEVAVKLYIDRVRKLCRPRRCDFKSIWILWAWAIVQLFPSHDFADLCQNWSEIPGYMEEAFGLSPTD